MGIKFFKKALAVSVLALAGSAYAGDTFVGVSVGQTKPKEFVTEAELIDEGYTSFVDVRDTSTAFKLTVGTALNKSGFVRAGLVSLGNLSWEASAPSKFEQGELTAAGLFADIGAQVKPVEQLAIYAKIGAAALAAQYSYVSQDGAISDAEEESKTSVVFVPGIGINFEPTKNIGIALEAERYLKVKAASGAEGVDVDVLSAGLYYKF